MKNINKNKVGLALGFGLLLAGASHSAHAGKEFDLAGGWKGSVGLQLQTFLVDVEDNVTGESSNRVQSGFDPSKLTIGVTAPEYNGVTVSGTFQYVQAINGPRSSGDATFNGADGGQAQVRVAEVAVSGGFGTVKLGRGLAIFGLQSLAHDTGSLPGVGRGGTVGGGGGTAGRIDYGYYYPDFHAGIQYASNKFGGFSFDLGLFDPINGVNDESTDLRLEGALKYNSKSFDAWAGFIDSRTEGEDEQSGFDLGAEVRFGPAAITAAYSDGTGTRCCVPSVDDFEQWFIEADVTFGRSQIGFSIGENELTDPSGALISEGSLDLLFWHYQLTPTFTIIAEYNNETITDASGVDLRDTDTLALGVNWQF